MKSIQGLGLVHKQIKHKAKYNTRHAERNERDRKIGDRIRVNDPVGFEQGVWSVVGGWTVCCIVCGVCCIVCGVCCITCIACSITCIAHCIKCCIAC